MSLSRDLEKMSIAISELAEDLRRAANGKQTKGLKPLTKMYKDKKSILKAKEDPIEEILEDGMNKIFGGGK